MPRDLTDKEKVLLLLKSYRVLRGHTQKTLAAECGVGKQAICEIERGNKKPWRRTLVAICDELAINATDRNRIFRFYKHKDIEPGDVFYALSRIREGEGLTQQQLADITGYTRSQVFYFEKGRGNAEMASVICDALKIPAEDKAAILEHFNENNGHQGFEDELHAEGAGEHTSDSYSR